MWKRERKVEWCLSALFWSRYGTRPAASRLFWGLPTAQIHDGRNCSSSCSPLRGPPNPHGLQPTVFPQALSQHAAHPHLLSHGRNIEATDGTLNFLPRPTEICLTQLCLLSSCCPKSSPPEGLGSPSPPTSQKPTLCSPRSCILLPASDYQPPGLSPPHIGGQGVSQASHRLLLTLDAPHTCQAPHRPHSQAPGPQPPLLQVE